MKPFERSEQTSSAIETATALLSRFQRGTTVPFEMVENAIGFSRHSPQWNAFWHRIKRDFRNGRGIVLDAWRWDGVRLLTHEEVLEVMPKRRQAKALRQYTRAVRELASLPDKELTATQRERKFRRLELIKAGRRQVLAKARLGAVLDKPRYPTMPKPKQLAVKV